jgi:hypothetical protein
MRANALRIWFRKNQLSRTRERVTRSAILGELLGIDQ